MVNTVKLCSSETSQAALVIGDIQKLYAFVEKVQVGMLKEVEDRLLVALLHKSKFTGWREVLVSMANQGLFNHHADLQTAVLLRESAANASPEDLEKAVKQAQSLEASKSLSKLVKAGPWATHIFEKMHACGATQKLQQAHSGSYTICGAGFAELITTTFAAHAFLILVGPADQEPDVERSTEFVEFQRATETVGATLKKKKRGPPGRDLGWSSQRDLGPGPGVEILQRGSDPGWQHLNCQQGEAGGTGGRLRQSLECPLGSWT